MRLAMPCSVGVISERRSSACAAGNVESAMVDFPLLQGTAGGVRVRYHRGVRPLCLLIFCVMPALAGAQQPAPAPPVPAQFEERIEVVAVTPVPGIGLSKLKIPANVQVFTAGTITSSTLDLPSLLAERAASVNVADAQAGTFQPDVVFRGFTGSPLLGASEGVAVYQDGV